MNNEPMFLVAWAELETIAPKTPPMKPKSGTYIKYNGGSSSKHLTPGRLYLLLGRLPGLYIVLADDNQSTISRRKHFNL